MTYEVNTQGVATRVPPEIEFLAPDLPDNDPAALLILTVVNPDTGLTDAVVLNRLDYVDLPGDGFALVGIEAGGTRRFRVQVTELPKFGQPYTPEENE